MPMTCLLLNEFVGGAVIDAAIPAIYSALLVFGAILFSVSFLALIICVIVILVSTNYWAFVYRPASLAHSRRKRKLKIIAANGGRSLIKFNATSSKANSSGKKSRHQPESISAYCRRVFHIVKRSLQYGITVLSYRGKREKKHFAARSVWCGMNRPLLIFRTSEDPRTKSTPISSSPTSPLSASKSFSAPFLSPSKTPFSPTPSFSAFYPTSSFSAFSPSPSRSYRNLYSRQVKSPGLSAVPVCVKKMLIISTDTAVQEREKERERRQKQRDRESGGGGRGGDTPGGGGRGGRGGRGEELGSRVRGRGGVQFSRQFSSTRSLGDELVVTRTGLADSSRRLVAPSIMFYSRQALTLMRSRLSKKKSNVAQLKSTSTHRRIFPMNSNEDSFPEADFTVEFRLILDVFYPDGMTLSNEAKEESCELFDIWKNEYFEWSDASTGGGGITSIQPEVRMINFKLFEDWFSNEFVFLIHSNLSDRIMDNITRSPVLAVTVKNKVKVKEVDEDALHCTTNAVSWFAPPPARARRRLGDLIREEEKEENRI